MSKKILRIKNAIELTGLSRSSIYLKMRADEFPKSISLGKRAVGWLQDDIQQWIDTRIQLSKDGN